MARAIVLILSLSLSLFAALLAGVVAPPRNTTTTTATMPCPSYQCGDAVAVRYPFWVAGGDATATATSHCGYPGLGLECRGETPVLTLPSGEYVLTGVLHRDVTLSLYDLAATNSGSCPEVAGRNLTLPAGSPPPLSLTRRDRNLTFLVGCNFTGFAEEHHLKCLQQGRLHTYVFRDEARIPYHDALLCQQVVGMPVLNPAADDVVAALRAGFELSWSAPAAGSECAACEQAGGLCGERREEAAQDGWSFLCFSRSNTTTSASDFPDGPFLTTKGKVAFSLIGIILLGGAVALILLHCGFCGEGHERQD